MLNTININLKADIKTDGPTILPIKLMSQDKNNNRFILRFTNGGEPIALDDSYTVEVLTKFRRSGTSRLTTASVTPPPFKTSQDYATWEFDTAYITQDEKVVNYVYVRKAGTLVVSADANAFVFDVGLSEIDKNAGRVAEVYDENYQKYLDEFKEKMPGGSGGSYDDIDVMAHMGSTNNPHNVTKSQVGLGNVNNTSDANKPVSTAMQSALNNKADKSQVLTNVPANAKFTDTTYTAGTGINIAGGVISATGGGEDGYDDTSIVNHMNDRDNPHNVTKAQVGLGNVNNTSDINKPISSAVQSALNNKADKSQVLTNVPANAKFTDTTYTHPSSHPASMITESSTKRFVTDAEKATWNSKTDDTAANAHITKKDNPHGVTKAQVGLGNVSNVAQASKTEFNTHNSDTTKHITASERTAWNSKQDALGFTAENTSKKGKAGGYASLDSTGRIPVTQLPDFEGGDVGTVGIPQTISKTGDTVTLSDDGGSISLSEYAKASQVLTNVPANAKFTDTVYTHPNSHPASMITESSTKRFVTDTEKATWNGKQNALVAGSNVTISGNTISATNTDTTYDVATATASGLMAATDKVKLNGIAANANNYTHPSSHPASMITESSTKRFVTDAEKADWNAKTDDTKIDAHIANKANPHGLSKSQIGLGNVANYGLATQAEAEAGVSTTKYMTPLRTHQVIEKIVSTIELPSGDGTGTGSANSLLTGLEWNALGDSITRGYGTTKQYHSYISGEHGIEVNAYGMDGTDISEGSIHDNPFVGRYASMSPSADIITVFGGVNDFFHNIPMGEFSSRDIYTFYGALHTLVSGIKNTYPRAKFGFITPLQTAFFEIHGTTPNQVGKKLIDYVNAIKEVCLFYNVPVLDLHNANIIDPFITSERTNLMPDGLHPNEDGHQKISVIIGNFLQYLAGDAKYIYSNNSDTHSLLAMVKDLTNRVNELEGIEPVEPVDPVDPVDPPNPDNILSPSSLAPFNATDIQIGGTRKPTQVVDDLSIPLELFQWAIHGGLTIFASGLEQNKSYTLSFEYEPQDANMQAIGIECNAAFTVSKLYIDNTLEVSNVGPNIAKDKFPIGIKQKHKVTYQFNTGPEAINSEHFIRIQMNPGEFPDFNTLFVTNLSIVEGHVEP